MSCLSHIRSEQRFLQHEMNWLERIVPRLQNANDNARFGAGRPQKADFNSLSESGKRKRVQDICSNHSSAELMYAGGKKLQTDGSKIAAKHLKSMSSSSDPEGKVAFKAALQTLVTIFLKNIYRYL